MLLLLLCRSGAELLEGRARVVGKNEVQLDGSNNIIRVSKMVLPSAVQLVTNRVCIQCLTSCRSALQQYHRRTAALRYELSPLSVKVIPSF